MNKFYLVIAVVAVAISFGQADARQTGKNQYKPGDTFKECRNCPEMVVIPPGTFMMGTPDTDDMKQDDEVQHKVTIAYSYAVSATEVTWNQWEACVRDGGCDGYAVETSLRLGPDGQPNKDYVDFGRGNRPVIGVSWYDALAYFGWLNKKTGHDDLYRLLTDSEWEYAARAGTTTRYPWGDKIDHNYGNFGNDSEQLGGMVEGRDKWDNETAPVASFPPNAFGLYDMQGNVFEWLQDCYKKDVSDGPSDGSPNLDSDCRTRMFRSGTFVSHPFMHRSGNRSPGYVPTTRGRNYLGIRVARTLE
jgi:formylglycine-generating enzyme required for sulfatase activity